MKEPTNPALVQATKARLEYEAQCARRRRERRRGEEAGTDAIDTNQLAAFIASGTNLPYLLNLEEHLRKRIDELLAAGVKPPEGWRRSDRPRPWPGRRPPCPQCGR